MNTLDPDSIDWAKSAGLVPAVVQHAVTKRVLMLGYMNRESLVHTQDTGKVTFFSRSRNKLWQKGETSGNTLDLERLEVDCDNDTILVFANPNGPTCHLLTESCFDSGSANPDVERTAGLPGDLQFLLQLQDVIVNRKAHDADSSYTSSLFQAGTAKIAQKVGEEGVEVALAALQTRHATDSEKNIEPHRDDLLGECADLTYHLLVLLADLDLEMADVVRVLQGRHGKQPT